MNDYIIKEPVVKMAPIFKKFLWGEEIWQLSAHKDGESIISDGEFEDFTFTEYLKITGKSILGKNCAKYDKFPLLVKFIEAETTLSIQVHPGDLFALNFEKEYGKNEMWYVADAKPGSFLYYGLKERLNKKKLREYIQNGKLTDVLNKVEVKSGDSFFVRAGVIHAIGAGIKICEVQQNSNLTYRIDDFNRKGDDGELRPLHIDKAIEVTDIDLNVEFAKRGPIEGWDFENGILRLVDSKYFVTDLCKNQNDATVNMDDDSFAIIVILEGEGTLSASDGNMNHSFKQDDTFFIHAGKRSISIKGSDKFLIVRV